MLSIITQFINGLSRLVGITFIVVYASMSFPIITLGIYIDGPAPLAYILLPGTICWCLFLLNDVYKLGE